jgi:hypothetical protein
MKTNKISTNPKKKRQMPISSTKALRSTEKVNNRPLPKAKEALFKKSPKQNNKSQK